MTEDKSQPLSQRGANVLKTIETCLKNKRIAPDLIEAVLAKVSDGIREKESQGLKACVDIYDDKAPSRTPIQNQIPDPQRDKRKSKKHA